LGSSRGLLIFSWSYFGAGNDFISQAFRDGLDSSERGVSSTDGHEVDGLGGSSHGRAIDGLLSGNTSSTDSGGIFSSTTILDSVDEDLDGVLTSDKVDDVEGVLNDSDGLSLLTGVSSVEHESSDESLNDGALSLSEFLDLVSTGCVGNEDLSLGVGDSNIISEADIFDLNFGIVPFVEKLEGASVFQLGFYTITVRYARKLKIPSCGCSLTSVICLFGWPLSQLIYKLI
jgi:hypothetical protein